MLTKKAIPHLNEVRQYAHAHGLPHFFLKDLMKAEKIHENTCKCIKEAGWIAGQLVRSGASQLDGCNRLIELFKLKWLSGKNPVTTANPWLLYEQLHHHLRERRGEVMLLSIDFDFANDSSIHDFYPEGLE